MYKALSNWDWVSFHISFLITSKRERHPMQENEATSQSSIPRRLCTDLLLSLSKMWGNAIFPSPHGYDPQFKIFQRLFRPALKIQSEEQGYLRICWHCVYSYFEVFQRQETSFEKSLQLQLWQWQLASRMLNLPEVILLLHLLFILAEASQQSLLDLIANTRTTKPSIFIYQPSIFMYQLSIFISAWALPKIIFTLMCISLDNSVQLFE